MVVVCFIEVVSAIGGIYCGARTAMAIGRDLRREVYYRVNEKFEAECYRDANQQLTRVSARVGNLFVLMFPVIMMIPRAAISAERLDEVLTAKPSLSVPAGRELPAGHAVEFSGVSFGYPGAERPVLNNVSFTAHEGRPRPLLAPPDRGSRPC